MNLFDFFKPKTFSHDTDVFTSEIRMVEMLACFSTGNLRERVDRNEPRSRYNWGGVVSKKYFS